MPSIKTAGFTVYTVVFLLGIIIGGGMPDEAMELVRLVFGEGDGETLQPYTPTLLLTIFLRNLATATLILASAPFAGLLPGVILLLNGFIVGGVVTYSITEMERAPVEVAALLLPHGVVEIPTLIYASAISLEAGLKILQGVFTREDGERLLRSYVRVILPLIFLAAVIETFITPWIASQTV